jgi:hypothetical protein
MLLPGHRVNRVQDAKAALACLVEALGAGQQIRVGQLEEAMGSFLRNRPILSRE